MGATFVGAEHDDALYILGSQALAFGNYTQWFLPGSPRFVNGPPGLPALLLPVGFFAPENLLLYQLMMAAVASLSVFFFWKATHRYFSEITAITLTAFFAANPVFLYRSGMVMPEIPALAVGLYLWWKQDRLSGWSIGAWLLAAYLIRPASVALWGAVWGTLLIQRQWKKGAFSLVLPLAGLALWSAWCHGYGGLQENKELAVFYKGDWRVSCDRLDRGGPQRKRNSFDHGPKFSAHFLGSRRCGVGVGRRSVGNRSGGIIPKPNPCFPGVVGGQLLAYASVLALLVQSVLHIAFSHVARGRGLRFDREPPDQRLPSRSHVKRDPQNSQQVADESDGGRCDRFVFSGFFGPFGPMVSTVP
jgi:hypothetical protein